MWQFYTFTLYIHIYICVIHYSFTFLCYGQFVSWKTFKFYFNVYAIWNQQHHNCFLIWTKRKWSGVFYRLFRRMAKYFLEFNLFYLFIFTQACAHTSIFISLKEIFHLLCIFPETLHLIMNTSSIIFWEEISNHRFNNYTNYWTHHS